MSDEMSFDEAIVAITDQDRQKRLAAHRVLFRMKGRRAVEALCRAMGHPDPAVRSQVALALGRLRAGHGTLARYLATDPDPHVRLMCASSLHPATTAAVSALLEALSDPADKVVVAACVALAGSAMDVAAQRISCLLNHRSWKVRHAAALALVEGDLVDPAVIQALEALNEAPEAAQHNAWASRSRELDHERHGGRVTPQLHAPLSTDELLETAKRKLHALSNEAAS